MARYDFNNLISSKATLADLPDIIKLLDDDALGKSVVLFFNFKFFA